MRFKDLTGKIYSLTLILLAAIFFTACSNLQEPECEITNLQVSLISCVTDSTYNLTINFDYKNPGNDFFEVYTRNDDPVGYFKLSELPLTLENFKRSGKDFDYIKVCINDHPECCEVLEFESPDCSDKACEISNLTVDIGDCTTENNYNLTIDFDYSNPGNNFFEVYARENKLLGYFKLTDLPITIDNFERSGKDFDFIRVCINDHPDCCEVLEFEPPDCSDKACEISNLVVDVGECTSENHYNLTLNFEYSNPNNNFFNVYGRENKLLGYYKLSDLPVTLENFEGSGNDNDFIKVCINDHPDCCVAKEFAAPDCSDKACEISNLVVDVGECTSKNHYNLTLNFEYLNPNNDFFNVYGRENKLLGYYKLSDLPVTLENFEGSGNDNDFIKVCINDHPDCCVAKEFEAPICTDNSCKIWNLNLEAGSCISDSTYNLTIDFSFENANNEFFEVFGRENKYIGIYHLSDLPVTIPDFKKSGKDYDFVKVCINDNSGCCSEAEIKSPSCQ